MMRMLHTGRANEPALQATEATSTALPEAPSVSHRISCLVAVVLVTGTVLARSLGAFLYFSGSSHTGSPTNYSGPNQ
jgi:hypothetical protein